MIDKIKNFGKNVNIADDESFIKNILQIMYDVERTYVNLVAINNKFKNLQIKQITDETIIFRLNHGRCEGVDHFSQVTIPFKYLNANNTDIITMHGHFCDMELIKQYKKSENELKEYKKNLFNKR